MRAALGIVSLLLALAVAGLLARKQLSSTRSAAPLLQQQPGAGGQGAGAAPSAALRLQGRQVPQPYQQALEGLVQQQARPVPDDAR